MSSQLIPKLASILTNILSSGLLEFNKEWCMNSSAIVPIKEKCEYTFQLCKLYVQFWF